MAVTPGTSLWIRRYNTAPGSPIRLACLPHAGGSASFFVPVSRGLHPRIEVLAVQYPGRQDRRGEPSVADIPTLARLVAAELAGWLDRPLALFGHSMGATLGFEVGRILEKEHGQAPAWLFASGRRAPSRHRDERVHEQDDNGLIAEMRRLSGTDAGILGDEELLRMILPAIRNDYRAAETYRYTPGPPLSCPITALVGDADPKVTVGEAESWREHTSAAFDLKVYPGGHFYLAKQQRAVLELIEARLATVTGPQVG
ncbi:thioesterase II family protein [Dactylosporangium sp. CA-092794]|uniref:thioesterase II family protein n=1 Tax=Dactylosporangium sp. CA-092794 TaxID=3239929 RepID=UPI003D9006E3